MTPHTAPTYVYVASSWRNPIQPAVCAALAAAGIGHYDFRNPPGGAGFGWEQVRPSDARSFALCEHCGRRITYSTMRAMGYAGRDLTNHTDQPLWRHADATVVCAWGGTEEAAPKKGSDWVDAETYQWMLGHPRAIEGFDADFGAMRRADTFVLVLPCGKSAHLELGWAVGAGKRTAILLEDPVEPELMYRMVDFMTSHMDELIDWVERP